MAVLAGLEDQTLMRDVPYIFSTRDVNANPGAGRVTTRNARRPVAATACMYQTVMVGAGTVACGTPDRTECQSDSKGLQGDSPQLIIT